MKAQKVRKSEKRFTLTTQEESRNFRLITSYCKITSWIRKWLYIYSYIYIYYVYKVVCKQ